MSVFDVDDRPNAEYSEEAVMSGVLGERARLLGPSRPLNMLSTDPGNLPPVLASSDLVRQVHAFLGPGKMICRARALAEAISLGRTPSFIAEDLTKYVDRLYVVFRARVGSGLMKAGATDYHVYDDYIRCGRFLCEENARGAEAQRLSFITSLFSSVEPMITRDFSTRSRCSIS